MIRHVVLCKFKPDVDEMEIQRIFAALSGLKADIPGILGITAGRDMSPEGLQRGFTHGFTVDFEDEAARDAYLPHPEHQKVGQMIVAACAGGVEGLVVVDWVV
jgi:hypothetical protein